MDESTGVELGNGVDDTITVLDEERIVLLACVLELSEEEAERLTVEDPELESVERREELAVLLVQSLVVERDVLITLDETDLTEVEEGAVDVQDFGEDETALHWPKSCWQPVPQ